MGDETASRFETEVISTSSSIATKGITGTEVTRIKNQNEANKEIPENQINLIYNYYINGQYIGHKSTAEDFYEYNNLEANTKYTIQVEIRNSATDEYLGSVVKQITTIDANRPELEGFNTKERDDDGNKLPITYYVVYDSNGDEIIGDKIENNGSNAPSNWYNYKDSEWANIVVTDGEIENGQIKNATKTTYYTWIPRYEFKIDSTQYKQLDTARTEVRFIGGTETVASPDYQIPEGFTFNRTRTNRSLVN